LLGWLAFRFRIEGVYFALLTIAFAEVARIGFDHIAATGGAGGFFLPVRSEDQSQWWNLRGGPTFFYYLALLLAAAAFVLCAILRRSRVGHSWLAVREDPEAARALGIDVNRARMSALLLSAAMTGIAGVFQAFYANNLFPSQIFDISRSIDIILAPIIGGVGTLFGPILGAFVLAPLGEVLISLTGAIGLNAPGTKALFFGLFLMAIIAGVPSGLWPRLAGMLRLRSAPR
jgi:branched-chain amino acid transport system permease protein